MALLSGLNNTFLWGHFCHVSAHKIYWSVFKHLLGAQAPSIIHTSMITDVLSIILTISQPPIIMSANYWALTLWHTFPNYFMPSYPTRQVLIYLLHRHLRLRKMKLLEQVNKWSVSSWAEMGCLLCLVLKPMPSVITQLQYSASSIFPPPLPFLRTPGLSGRDKTKDETWQLWENAI